MSELGMRAPAWSACGREHVYGAAAPGRSAAAPISAVKFTSTPDAAASSRRDATDGVGMAKAATTYGNMDVMAA